MSLAHEDAIGDAPVATDAKTPTTYALLGNPNTGKTTLFNRLCGVRAKTANFPGSTVDARIGRMPLGDGVCTVVDLPGLYGLNLDRPESQICRRYLHHEIDFPAVADAVLIVVDASNIRRNLVFANQALQQGLPAVVALNMTDVVERRGIVIDVEALERQLGCPVVPIVARNGTGLDQLRAAMTQPRMPSVTSLASPTDAAVATQWATEIVLEVVSRPKGSRADAVSDRLDRVVTHPVLGLVVFAALMTGLFFTIFTLASVPMDLIELLFAQLGQLVGAIAPPGPIHDLLVDGVVSGVAGTLVFLPQICLLFFLISLLEDTGYLSRAAFVVDRVLRRFGLPGHAFVPLLSAHACAIPAIMSARLIPDQRQRIATILVAPFMSCSARLPVYVLLVGILFGGRPLLAGLAFTGCYMLGAVAALTTALIVRRTILRGPAAPMVLELPPYRLPSLRTAFITTLDRGWLFLRKAGTVILAICVVLWWLSAYPTSPEPDEVITMRAEAAQMTTPADATALIATADSIATRHALAGSFAGRIGHGLEPIFRPIGLDWQLTVGVVTSFAAREVFVSTLAVLFAGNDDAEDTAVRSRIIGATRDDGSLVFTMRTAASLLVFYVLAMQCLPTLPVTARESGHWKWAALQFVYMSALAYVFALVTFMVLGLFGVT